MTAIVYDTEMGEYGLDDCERRGTDLDCGGRIGGVIVVDENDEGKLRSVLCENHFNAPACSHCGSTLVNEDCPNYGDGEAHA